MSPQVIRVIDTWLGAPLCWVLTVLRRLGDLFRRPHDDTVPPKRILFIKLIELGANVQASAALRRAAEMVGRENVYFWVFEENRPIIEILDLVPPQNVLAIRSDRLWTFALDTLRTLWRIRRLKIDAVVDMEFFARASAILTYLSGARRRVGLFRFTSAGPYRGDLMTHRVQHNPYTHVSMYFHLLVEALTTPRDELPIPKRHFPENDAARVDRALRSQRRSDHQRQWAGPVRLHDRHPHGGAFRPRDTPTLGPLRAANLAAQGACSSSAPSGGNSGRPSSRRTRLASSSVT